MSCNGCVKSVTKALHRVNGVNVVGVDLEGQNATVTFNETLTNIEALKRAVADAGYDSDK